MRMMRRAERRRALRPHCPRAPTWPTITAHDSDAGWSHDKPCARAHRPRRRGRRPARERESCARASRGAVAAGWRALAGGGTRARRGGGRGARASRITRASMPGGAPSSRAPAPWRWTPRSWRATRSATAPWLRHRRPQPDHPGPADPRRRPPLASSWATGAMTRARALGVPLCDPARARHRAAAPAARGAPAGHGGRGGARPLRHHRRGRTSTGGTAGKLPGPRRRLAAHRLRHLRREHAGRRVVHRRRRGHHPRGPGAAHARHPQGPSSDPVHAAQLAISVLVEEGRGQGGLILIDCAGPAGAGRTPPRSCRWASCSAGHDRAVLPF